MAKIYANDYQPLTQADYTKDMQNVGLIEPHEVTKLEAFAKFETGVTQPRVDELRKWHSNTKPQSEGRQPYVMSFSGMKANELRDVTSQKWQNLQSDLEDRLRVRIAEMGFVEAHTDMSAGAGFMWARAIANVKQEVGDDRLRMVVDLDRFNRFENLSGSQMTAYDNLFMQADQITMLDSDDSKYSAADLRRKTNQIMTARSDEHLSFISPKVASGDLDDNDVYVTAQDAASLNHGFGDTISSVDYGMTDVDAPEPVEAPKTVTVAGKSDDSDEPEPIDLDEPDLNQPAYLFEPDEFHHAYRYLEKGDTQDRFWWRDANVDPASPVSVPELKNALTSAMPNSGRRNSLNAILKSFYTDTVNVSGQDQRQVDLVGYTDSQNRVHEVSPSDVETMISVLTVVHDAGLDYDIRQRDNSIELQLNDNSGSSILLMDPQHPYLTGQVRTRHGAYWSPELTRIPFKTEAEAAKNPDGKAQHALGGLYDAGNKRDLSPYSYSRGTETFRQSQRDMERLMPHGKGEQDRVDRDESILRSRARYAGLDQHSKNRLATAGVVNLLGVLKSGLSDSVKADIPDATVETIDRNQSDSKQYQAQLNLGDNYEANIAPVEVISHEGQDTVSHQLDDQTQGKIQLDLRSAVVGDDRSDMSNTNPAYAPFRIEENEADPMINIAYRQARITYLKTMMGPDLAGTDRDAQLEQARFKRSLADAGQDVVLNDSLTDTFKQEREPLALEDQQAVLTAFSDGLLHATADDKGVHDDVLVNNRRDLGKGVKDPILKARRLRAFDNLVGQFSKRFGNAPIVNGVKSNDVGQLTPQDYLSQYQDLTKNLSTSEAKQVRINELNEQLAVLLQDHATQTLPDFARDEQSSAISQMTYDEQRQRLMMVTPSGVRDSVMHKFDKVVENLTTDYPLHDELNLTRVIEQTEAGANSTLYGFEMAQAVGKSSYTDKLVGDNSYANQNVQERAVNFDSAEAKRLNAYKQAVMNGEHFESDEVNAQTDFESSTAKTINQLRAEDADPSSHEAQLQQYLADVKAGRKEFSFDPAENPEPTAFSRDGNHLIYPESHNEGLARALETVKSRLEARGAVVNDEDLQVDAQGIVHFKVQLPLYQATSHEQHHGGKTYVQYNPNGRLGTNPNATEKDGYAVKKVNGSVYLDKDPDDPDGHPSYQPIEGSFGQIFVPDHDGLVRSQYNRFDGQDPTSGQITYKQRYRGWFLSPDRDVNGNWDKEMFRAEKQNGLGHFNRLRVRGYEQSLLREVGQAVDTVISTRDIGDVTRYNSNTILNKLLHSEVLGERVDETTLSNQADEWSQAKLETEMKAVRIEDAAFEDTKAPAIVTYMRDFQKELHQMRQNGQLTDPSNEEETVLDVVAHMHNSVDIYGGHTIGNVADSSANLYVSDNMTGQGKMFGLLLYLVEGAQVNPDGSVTPNAFKNSDGSLVKDENGRVVGYGSGAPIENAELNGVKIFDGTYKNAADRQSIGGEQALKAHETVSDAKIASMSMGGMTTEDGMAISKDFAEKHQISDQVDDNGNPIMRPLTIGDKLSDNGGNKATIGSVIDPDMDLEEAERQGVLEQVEFFRQNPELDIVMNGMSQISRNNGGTSDMYLKNNAGHDAPLMSYQRVAKNGNGEYEETGETVQTNATMNTGVSIITDQTVNHKVTLYDKPGDDTGRKESILLNNSDNTKGAHVVGNWHRRYGQNLQMLRQSMLTMGVDVYPDHLEAADMQAIAENTNIVDYQISDANLAKIDYGYNKLLDNDGDIKKGTRNINDNDRVFDGIDPVTQGASNPQLTGQSQRFLSALSSVISHKGMIAANREQVAPDRYDAGTDFLQQLPDGGVLQLPEGMHVMNNAGEDVDKLYILPERMRKNTRAMDDTTIVSDFNRLYQNLGTNIAKYQLLKKATDGADLAHGDAQTQQLIDDYLTQISGVQGSVNRISVEANKYAFGGNSVKNGFFRNYILGGYARDSVTSQLSSNPTLPLDVIEISPQIAKRLNFVTGEDGMAHIKDHPTWDRLHVHRDPVWREQGSLGFRVKINDDLTSVRISPVVAAVMDADFDGDNVGLISMPNDDAQREMREVMSVDQWMLDNAQESNLLNMNAEFVDMAHNTGNTFRMTGVNGQEITGGFNDPVFRKQALEQMRSDVVDPSWFNENGELTHVDDTGAPDVNDGDFLNMLTDHEIKQHYTDHDYVGARQMVDELAQRARGFETTRDVNGEVELHQGRVSMLAADGVNYQNKDTMRNSLYKFADEGAKGSRSKVDGLFDYLNKPNLSDLIALGKTQVKDGQLDTKARQQYLDQLSSVHDMMSLVQQATDIKSDVTGVPGQLQQNLTALMFDSDEQGMHAANAIGQAGTQKILSIKHDPVVAVQTTEIMQNALSDVFAGKFPTQQYPRFALMGTSADGRLGFSPADISLKADILQGYRVPETNKKLGEYGDDLLDSSKFSDEQLLAVGQNLNMKLDPKDSEQLNGFRQTLAEASQPFLRDDFSKDLQAKIAQDENKPLGEVKVPADTEVKPGQEPKITHREFVAALDYLYNDKEHGMGLGVDPQNFELIAQKLEDPEDSKKPANDRFMLPLKDATLADGSASFMAKVNMQGFDAVSDELSRQKQQPDSTPQNMFGEDGSYIRSSVMGGLSDAELKQQLDLNSRDNKLDQQVEKSTAQAAQDELLAKNSTEFAKAEAITDDGKDLRPSLDESSADHFKQESAAIMANLNAKVKATPGQLTSKQRQDVKQKPFERQLKTSGSGRYGMIHNEITNTIAYAGAYTPFSNDYRTPFSAKVEIDDQDHGIKLDSGQKHDFESVTQYVQYAKALLAGDQDVAQQVLDTPVQQGQVDPWSPLTKNLDNLDARAWNTVSPLIVKDGMAAKVEQNDQIRDSLLSTGTNDLVEANGAHDKFSGSGLSLSDVGDGQQRFDGSTGQNVNGRLLSEVRQELTQGNVDLSHTQVELDVKQKLGANENWQPQVSQTTKTTTDVKKPQAVTQADVTREILDGNYWSPFEQNQATGGTVNGQVGNQLVANLEAGRKTKINFSQQVKQNLLKTNADRNTYDQNWPATQKQLLREFKQQTTGQSEDKKAEIMRNTMANAYYTQMKQDPTVANVLHATVMPGHNKDVLQRVNDPKDSLSANRANAMYMAVQAYDKRFDKQTAQNKDAAVKQQNSGLER